MYHAPQKTCFYKKTIVALKRQRKTIHEYASRFPLRRLSPRFTELKKALILLTKKAGQ